MENTLKENELKNYEKSIEMDVFDKKHDNLEKPRLELIPQLDNHYNAINPFFETPHSKLNKMKLTQSNFIFYLILKNKFYFFF